MAHQQQVQNPDTMVDWINEWRIPTENLGLNHFRWGSLRVGSLGVCCGLRTRSLHLQLPHTVLVMLFVKGILAVDICSTGDLILTTP